MILPIYIQKTLIKVILRLHFNSNSFINKIILYCNVESNFRLINLVIDAGIIKYYIFMKFIILLF